MQQIRGLENLMEVTPISIEYESPHATPRRTSVSLTSPRKCILLVEDDTGIREAPGSRCFSNVPESRGARPVRPIPPP